eukprot:CAMPEP_0181101582 /NCGR_PEP_ID=MMETSP1071-20121207/13836_1 /TAXON_ID=35127 /ORGANISM="Thalassiosira sp., Strain NH16" /LENGTH=549 /DNA_ID=CAMNT_0023184453 /DNA_START=82 /DNA_END=1731 /DNA_ORIENTATION=-
MVIEIMMNNHFPHHPSNNDSYPFAAASGGKDHEPVASPSRFSPTNTPSHSHYSSQQSQSQGLAHQQQQQNVIAAELLRMQQAREEESNAFMQLQLIGRQQMNASAAGGGGASSASGSSSGGAPFAGMRSLSGGGGEGNNPFAAGSPSQMMMGGRQVMMNGHLDAGAHPLGSMNGGALGSQSQMAGMSNFMPSSTFADSINMMNPMNAASNHPAGTSSVAGGGATSFQGFTKVPQDLPFDSQMTNFMMTQPAFANNGPRNMNGMNMNGMNMNSMEYLQNMNSMGMGQQLGLHSLQGGLSQSGTTFQKDAAGQSIMDPDMQMQQMLGAFPAAAGGVPNIMGNCQQSQLSPLRSQEDPGWDQRYKDLRTYHLEFGNCRVPARYGADPVLGRWVMTQRRQFSLLMKGFPSALTADRIRRLEELGFSWSVRPEPVTTWNRKLQELKVYKATHGNCMVPQRYQANPQLGTWVHTQRRQYKLMMGGKKSSMTKEKANALDSIGFFWAAKHDAVSQQDSTASTTAASSSSARDYVASTSLGDGGSSDEGDAGVNAKA